MNSGGGMVKKPQQNCGLQRSSSGTAVQGEAAAELRPTEKLMRNRGI